MENENTLGKNLRIYDQSITNLSEEDLKGRYCKSFNALVKSLKEQATAEAQKWLIDRYELTRVPSDEEMEELNSVYESARKRLCVAIWKDRDFEEFYAILLEEQAKLDEFIGRIDGRIRTIVIEEEEVTE